VIDEVFSRAFLPAKADRALPASHYSTSRPE
jgi:hypothetical protein